MENNSSRQVIYEINGNDWTWMGNVVWFVNGVDWECVCSWMGVYGEWVRPWM